MQERRKTKRWMLFHQARFRLEESGYFTDCMLCDISFWGAKISSQAMLELGSAIEMHMDIPDALHPLIIKARIVHIRLKPRFCYEYGLAFINIKQKDREKIFDYIYKNYPSEFKRSLAKGNINIKGGEEKMFKAELMQDRRIFARIPVDFYARYFDSRNNKEGYFVVLDIGAKGMGIAVKEKIKQGAYLEIWVNIPNSKNPIYIRGEVVWVEANDKASGYRAGISLERADFMRYPSILKA